MNDVPFHLTVMGKRFYEATMLSLVEAIERLNENLERLVPRIEAALGAQSPANPEEPSLRPGG